MYQAGVENGRVGRQAAMAAGAGDHLMLFRLGLGDEQAEGTGSSTTLQHENVVRLLRPPPSPCALVLAPRAKYSLVDTALLPFLC